MPFAMTEMDISLVRVDNRLIHGQILEAWVPFLQAEVIIVADDGVANDFFRETVVRMAVPREIDVVICCVSDLVKKYPHAQGKGRKTIVLFGDVGGALQAHLDGFHFDRLNLGNIYKEECVMNCSPSVQLDSEDVKDILTLMRAGVAIDLKRVPMDNAPDMKRLLRESSSGADIRP